MFWLEEGRPASLSPRKRPRTTLTPSLALRDGVPYMAFGTPGGDQQDQWSFECVSYGTCIFGLNLQEAIDAPEFHTAHFPSSFYPRECRPGHVVVEGRFPPATIDARRRGHDLEVDADWSLGHVSAASKDGPLLKAAANPRFMQGYAAGR